MKKFVILICAVVIPMALSAAPKNDLPQGKPFQNLQSQIDSLKADMEALIGQVHSMEERFAAIESAIADLQALNQDLQYQISSNDADIDALQAQIDYNNNLIAMMQAEIEQLQTDLALKQNLINGTCPEGQAVVSIEEDGSLVCANAGGSQVETVTAYNSVCIPGYYGQSCDDSSSSQYYRYRSVTATCPDGYIATGGGFSTGTYVDVLSSRPYSTYGFNNRTWFGYARNAGNYGTNLYIFAVCMK